MAKSWILDNTNSESRVLLNGDGNVIRVDKYWYEVSPTQAATLPSGTKMLDANNQELTLLDGYCTTYFYKGWQTASPMVDGKIGNIIDNKGGSYRISDRVGPTVAEIETKVDLKDRYLQIVRLPNGKVGLPKNVGENLISDLYPGIMWGTAERRKNWYNQWGITPLAPANFSISDQTTDLPRTFTIDETNIPGYGTDTNKSFYAPELFAPYMYLRNQSPEDGIYVGGIIVVIGVKKLSSGAKGFAFYDESVIESPSTDNESVIESDSTDNESVIESPSTDNESVIESPSTEIQQAEALNDNVEDKELS